ncbi:hypothetical protein KR215_008751, partial [Drosophila sulfurigaster]
VGGIMDLRNLCQRIDVDSLKAKLPAMPQLKLPKTLPKLRGARRIFRSSRDNVNKAASHEGAAVGAGGGGGGGGVSSGQLALPQQQQQAAQFINRTPQRISTISSLMHEQTSTEQQQQQHHHHHLQPSGATYCSAGSLDDDYYAPYGGSMTARVSRPISPIKMPPTGGDQQQQQQQQQQQERGTLTQRLQRGYKSLSELRLKHLFAKQTVVRRDNIEVQRYVEQYEAERRVEQMAQARRDRDIADNYDIHISTLPITRQNTLKQQQQDGEEADEDAVQQVRRMADHSGDESGLETPPPAVARKKKPGGIAATRFAKVRQPPLQMPVEEGAMDQQQQQPSQEKQPMRQAVRQKLKRLRKSMKRRQASQQQQQQQDSDDEEEEQEKQQQQQRGSTASNLRARLRRFASSEQLQQRWRKSFKAGLGGAGLGGANKGGAGLGGGATAAGSGFGVAAQLERSLARLNEKLQQLKFFQRKSQQPQGNKPNTVGREPIEIDDEELPATYHHSDSDSEHGSNDSDDSGQDICAEDAFGQLDIGADAPRSASPMLVKHQTLATLAQLQAHASTAWSSESLEEDIALDGQQQQQRDEMACTAADYPRVLIHQQHSDAYESTLIIAVTTTPPTPSPPHSQQHQQHQQQPWLPNEQIIAGFKEQQQRDCWPAPMLYKPKSIDIFESGDGGAASAFADFDEALRNAPVLRISAGSSCDSNTEDADDNSSRVTRIRVQTPRIGNSRESLMEQQTLEQEEEQEEEAEEALEELEEGQEQPEDQLEMERAEEESERPPSMSPPPPPLPQRRPPPPTSAAPIYDAVPPPLPISKPPTTLATATAPPPLTAATTTVATATPTTPPVTAGPPTPASPVAAAPPLQRQPLRSASMTRPAKPLVKTSSLRLTYNEQMHPNDVGKVNKLISRFGGRSRLGARRLHSEELTICSDGDDESEELPEEPATPTPANVKRSSSSNNNNNNVIPDIVTTAASSNNNNNETIQLDRHNSNCSRSEYGSPLAYPQLNATPTATATTTTTATSARAGRPRAPQPQSQPQLQLQSQSQLQLQRRSRRSMTRDDDNFYSFDSDEENSYYSISPSSSSRYVVEI